jgi:nitrate reductase NapA
MCNEVTLDAVDPVSRQPEFEICAVKLEQARGTA